MLINNVDAITTYTILKLIPEKTSFNFKWQNAQSVVQFLGSKTRMNATSDYSSRIYFLEFIFTTEEERYYLYDFYRQQRGSAYGFWIPLYLNDIRVFDHSNTNFLEIQIYHNNLNKSFRGYERLADIDFNTRTIYIRNISSISEIDSNTEKITLSEQPNRVFNRGENLYKLIYGRFSDKEIVINYQKSAKGNYIAKATIDFIELPYEVINL